MELAQEGLRDEQDEMLDKEAELTEGPELNELNLKRDVEPLNRNVDALKTEETADTMELGRDLEGTLELLEEDEKDDLTEKAARIDCSKPGGPTGTSPAPSQLSSNLNDQISPWTTSDQIPPLHSRPHGNGNKEFLFRRVQPFPHCSSFTARLISF